MNEKLLIMKEGKISKSLISLSLPSIIGVLITSVYNFTDALFVGRIGTEAIGATTMVYPLVTLLPALGLLFSNGASAYMSELLGANKKDDAEKVLISSLVYSLMAGFLMQILILSNIEGLLKLVGTSNNIMPLAMEYGRYVIGGGIFQIMAISLANVVRPEGEFKLSMYSQVFGAILNVLLNPIFIFKLNLGLRGAAIATLLSQVGSILILLRHYISGNSYLKLSYKNISFSKNIFISIVSIGLPIFATFIFQSISMAFLNRYSAFYGDDLVAAIGIVSKISSIPTLAVTGFSRGYQNMVSFNYGAKNHTRVKESTRLAIIWSSLFLLIISLIQIVFSRNLISIFSRDINVIVLGSRGLIANSIFLFTYGIQTIYMVYMLSTGRRKLGLFLSLSRQGIFFIPIIISMNNLFGLKGLFLSQGISDLLTTIVTIILIIYISRKEGDDQIIHEYS